MGTDRFQQKSLHWKRVDKAFEDAIRQPPEERESWVRRRYRADADLRDAVLELLAVDESSAKLFDRAMEDRDALAAEIADDDDVSVDLVGKRIGVYRLESLLATGGMGAVYRAERDDGEFRQTVAVKILPLWATGRQTISRLRAERQILSSLQHPGIAPLLDGGQTGDGFPYLVTAFIDGEPINRFVQDRSLELESILRMFLEVADAVDYAHGEGVVHRDLKPSNILVDKTGHPQLLDFGIAKIEGGRLPDLTVPRTMTGFVAMTPEYASPEQRRGDDVGMSSDVYQLGLLLFELLTGTRAGSPGDSAWQSPPLPSVAVRARIKPDPDLDREALRRRSRELRGDLDTCVLKALREDPAERYASAGELADDLRRYLAGEPIGARREPLLSRLRRGIGSRPVPAVLAVILLVALAWTVSIRLMGGEPPNPESRAVPAGEGPVAESEAMRLYERGRALLDQRSAAGMSSAILHFERALDADPNLAKAWTGIADALLIQLTYGHSDDPEDIERAELAVQRAIEIDPKLAEAWTALGTLEYQRRDAPAALEAYETAIDCDPSYAAAYTLSAYTLGLLGKFETAMTRAREGARLDPLAAEAFVNVSGSALSLGRTEEALEAARRAVEVSPGWPSTRFSLALAQFYAADFNGAMATFEGLTEPWLGAAVALFQLRADNALGRTAAARARLPDIEASGDLYALATAHAALDDRDRGYELLRDIQTWGDLPTLLFQGPDRQLWDPDAGDSRYLDIREQLQNSWGVVGDGGETG
jgi:serine/threonine protein kinase/Tfp pilus assembly protein PilF